MYSIGDTIIYTTTGVCKVNDIVKRQFNGNLTEYYVLKPVHDEMSTITVPANNPLIASRFLTLSTKDEIYSLLAEMPTFEVVWYDKDNDRKAYYSETIRSGNRKKIFGIIKTIKLHQAQLKEKGRKLHACDDQALKDCEKLACEEISYVFDISLTEALNLLYKN